MPLSGLEKLEEKREAFLRFLERRRPHGSLKNKVTVVFDGQPGIWGGGAASGVEVIFAKGRSADEEIKAVVAGSEHRKNMAVVTDDREIQYAVRALGAKVCGVDEFLEKAGTLRQAGKEKPSVLSPQDASAGKYISKTLEHKITSEMERIWLKRGSSKS
ncbi:MAG: hypothetical protein A3D87_07320 [Omnitrophica WOR_2 bacterium RIFCSPHIGHO2_02_FULL_50_17]|nr:MAG: hypothetical protein A3D87_07320 [Omnitrophica WOR_2 bacterium RIFCSPHIGHO2_02_FULL_50_17]